MTAPAFRLLAALLCATAGSSAPAEGPLYREVRTAAQLEAAARAMPAVGGTIRLRPGVYVLRAPLRFRKVHYVNIAGAGWNTTIQRTGGGSAIEFEDCSFCVVRDLMVAGDGSAGGNGIRYTGTSSSNTVLMCRISGFSESGVRYAGDPKMPQSSNSVRDCHLIDNGGDQIGSQHNNDFYMMGNQFGAHARKGAEAPRSGTNLDHSAAGTYSANYHWGNRVALRIGPGSHFNRVENNRFEESLEAGVVIGDAAGKEGVYLNIVVGNTIHTNSQSRPGAFNAVEAHHAGTFTFTSNQVFSWDSGTHKHRSSLVLGAGCRGWIVKDNVFHHNTGPAVAYDEAAGHIVKDNQDR